MEVKYGIIRCSFNIHSSADFFSGKTSGKVEVEALC